MMRDFAPIERIAGTMRDFPRPWFVSGGWAIDLFLGAVTRQHDDLEVGIFRQDQAVLYDYLAGCDLFKAVSGPDGGEWVPWQPGEYLHLPIHQILARPTSNMPAEFEFFLNEATDGVWRFRRNQRITRPIAEIVLHTASGIPFLAPEIQLAYKARHHRPKDDHDFEHALGRLNAAQRGWLRQVLPICYGDDPWMAQLKDEGDDALNT